MAKTKKIRKEYIIFCLQVMVIVSVFIIIIMNVLLYITEIDGHSMEPTLSNNEIILSNRRVSRNNLSRFDILMIDTKKDGIITKRLIGFPGETIAYKDGQLIINGVWFQEPFLNQEYISKHTMDNQFPFTQDFGPFTLGDNEYFVLGDNRLNSKDSRFFGPITFEMIIAKDIIVIFPFDQFRVENTYELSTE